MELYVLIITEFCIGNRPVISRYYAEHTPEGLHHLELLIIEDISCGNNAEYTIKER